MKCLHSLLIILVFDNLFLLLPSSAQSSIQSFTQSLSRQLTLEDGQTANLLLNFTNSTTPTTIQSTVPISGNLILIAGIITYPSNFVSLSTIANDPNLVSLESHRAERTASLLLLYNYAESKVIWATRNIICSNSARFTVLANEETDTVFLLGTTLGAYNSTENSTSTEWKAGPAVASFKISTGERENISVHGVAAGSTSTYDKAFMILNKTILSFGYCSPFVSPAYLNSPNSPQIEGICGSIIPDSTQSLSDATIFPLSISEDGTQVTADKLWDASFQASINSNDSLVYLAVRRTVTENFIANVKYVILSFSVPSLDISDVPAGFPEQIATYDLPDEFQTQIFVSGIQNQSVVVSYIGRTNATENISTHRLSYQVFPNNTNALVPQSWTFTTFLGDPQRPVGSFWQWRLDLLNEVGSPDRISRIIPSTVQDVCTSLNGSVTAILLYTSDLVDPYVLNADELNKLTNGRVAVVAMDSSSGQVLWVSQSWRTDWWLPEVCAFLDNDIIFVGGADLKKEEDANFKTPSSLLTAVKNPSSRKRDVPLTTSTTSTPSPSATSDEGTCIGASSMIQGKNIIRIIENNDKMRLQQHIYRKLKAISTKWNKVSMLCVEWSSASRLCATALHIIKWKQKTMYMKDFCEVKDIICRVEIDEIINFKGVCGGHGDEIDWGEGLRVTMHSGRKGISAIRAVEHECRLQLWSWPIWWLTTI